MSLPEKIDLLLHNHFLLASSLYNCDETSFDKLPSEFLTYNINF